MAQDFGATLDQGFGEGIAAEWFNIFTDIYIGWSWFSNFPQPMFLGI